MFHVEHRRRWWSCSTSNTDVAISCSTWNVTEDRHSRVGPTHAFELADRRPSIPEGVGGLTDHQDASRTEQPDGGAPGQPRRTEATRDDGAGGGVERERQRIAAPDIDTLREAQTAHEAGQVVGTRRASIHEQETEIRARHGDD